MKIDVSYKAVKKLMKLGGEKIFNGLVTIMNEHSEICSQFYVATDAHDQYSVPIEEMMHTFEEYGHEKPELLIVDNPSQDKVFLLSALPSVAKKEQEYEAMHAELLEAMAVTVNNANMPTANNNTVSNASTTTGDATNPSSSTATDEDDTGETTINEDDTGDLRVTYLNTHQGINTSQGLCWI